MAEFPSLTLHIRDPKSGDIWDLDIAERLVLSARARSYLQNIIDGQDIRRLIPHLFRDSDLPEGMPTKMKEIEIAGANESKDVQQAAVEFSKAIGDMQPARQHLTHLERLEKHIRDLEKEITFLDRATIVQSDETEGFYSSIHDQFEYDIDLMRDRDLRHAWALTPFKWPGIQFTDLYDLEDSIHLMVESSLFDHYEDAIENVVDLEELEASVSAFLDRHGLQDGAGNLTTNDETWLRHPELIELVERWNAKQNIVSYSPDYTRVVILDEGTSLDDVKRGLREMIERHQDVLKQTRTNFTPAKEGQGREVYTQQDIKKARTLHLSGLAEYLVVAQMMERGLSPNAARDASFEGRLAYELDDQLRLEGFQI